MVVKTLPLVITEAYIIKPWSIQLLYVPMQENYFASLAVARVLRKTLHCDIKEALQLSLAITVLWGNFRPKLQHHSLKKGQDWLPPDKTNLTFMICIEWAWLNLLSKSNAPEKEYASTCVVHIFLPHSLSGCCLKIKCNGYVQQPFRITYIPFSNVHWFGKWPCIFSVHVSLIPPIHQAIK